MFADVKISSKNRRAKNIFMKLLMNGGFLSLRFWRGFEGGGIKLEGKDLGIEKFVILLTISIKEIQKQQ